MGDYEIKYLADAPEHIQACAAWAYGRWGVQKKDSNLEHALSFFQKCAQTNQVPLTLIIINKENNLPIAMGSLWKTDGTEWPDKTPWIASVYTLYRYRKLGLATCLIARLEQEVKRLGFDKVYLQSGSAADFYRKLGYCEIETVQTNATLAGTETLFVKTFGIGDKQ